MEDLTVEVKHVHNIWLLDKGDEDRNRAIESLKNNVRNMGFDPENEDEVLPVFTVYPKSNIGVVTAVILPQTRNKEMTQT